MGKVQESFAAWCRRNGREKLLELYDEAANETSAGEISFSSAVPRNWRCPDCGMSWRGSPNKMNRLRPGTYHVIRKRRTETYCPYCKGERVSSRYHLGTEIPWAEKFWDTERNGPDRTPERYLPGSHQKFYLRCPDCGYRFPRAVCLRDIHTDLRCPECGGGRSREITERNCLAAQFPQIAGELVDQLNGGVTGWTIGANFRERSLWFRCSRGHLYQAWVYNRTGRGDGCPQCGERRRTSFIEQAIFFYMQKCSRNVQNNCEDRYGNRVDILLPDRRTAVEYDSLYYHRTVRRQSEADALARALNKYRKLARHYRVYVLTEWAAEAEALSKLDSPLIIPVSVPVYAYTAKILSIYNQKIYELLRMMFPQRDSYPNIDIQRDELKILAQYIRRPVDGSFQDQEPQLAKDWDRGRNGPLAPGMFLPGTPHRFYWICRRCGASYRMSMYNRQGRDPETCPGCARKSGYPSRLLCQCYPQLAAYWDEQLNEIPFREAVVASEKRGIFRSPEGELLVIRICSFSGWLRQHPDKGPEDYLDLQIKRRREKAAEGETTGGG